MISTQRLLMITIGINLLIGLVSAAYGNITAFDEDDFTTQICGIEDKVNQFDSSDEYSGVTNREFQQETSIGNPISWGKVLLDTFRCGLNPFGFTANDFEHTMEKMVAFIIMLFRSLMWILLILEIYLLFKNKKAS